ncbi:Uncharacterised protein [Pantoea agglomerans]|uniref:Uncharacterized protein n=1 Tax=Enterobacter agglomerans TaxID=549 RepID=A0A379LSX4_ENTAG|nr:Uncharacterised protein [Pantoea agglomerans]
MLTETGKEYLRYVTEAFDILHLGQQNIRHAASAPKLHGLHIAGAGVQMAVAPSWRAGATIARISISRYTVRILRSISPRCPPIL